VYDAAVVPVPHVVKGYVPVAMVVADADESTLKTHCLENGPAYAHPRRVVVVESMPLNGVGKADRLAIQHALEKQFGPEMAS